MNDLIQPVDGFGASTMAELAELRKALDIGVTDPPTGYDSLRVESLEATLKLLTYRAEHIRLWQQIPKSQAFSTIEEYNRLEQYGGGGGVFNPSGVLPEEEDSTYSRQNQLVKFLGSTRVVTHPATLVRTVPADLIAQETQNGALWLMGRMNLALYEGDATMVTEEFNGIGAQIEDGSGNIVDLRGAPLTQADIESAQQDVVDQYGRCTDIFANPAVFSDFAQTFHTYQRFAAPGSPMGVVGTPVTGYHTMAGTVRFQADTFARFGSTPPAAATSSRAPTAPTLAVTTNRNAADTITASLTSQFAAADAGDYIWQVSAFNRFGESLPSAVTAATTIVEGGSVLLTITDGGGTDAATAYKLYRTATDGTTTTFIVNIARDAATTTHNDVNDDLPACSRALMLDMTDQSLTFRQLSPMVRMPLATIAPSIRWMQLIYGTPIVYQPLKNVLFKNVGRLS
jgi:hypothetical protein